MLSRSIDLSSAPATALKHPARRAVGAGDTANSKDLAQLPVKNLRDKMLWKADFLPSNPL